MRRQKRFTVLLLWLIAVCAMRASVPGLLNFQGRLLVGPGVFHGTGQFKFSLINSDGSQLFWSNSDDLDADDEPDAAVSLTVERGLYAVLLGDTNLANMAALPADVFTNNPVYLRVWFSDGTNGFQVLVPDQRVAAVGYAMLAATVPDGSITAAKLAPGLLSLSNLNGTLSAAQIPGLDAAKITSGQLDPARLPANVAFLDLDVLPASNALHSIVASINAALLVELTSLSNRLSDLSERIGSGSNGFVPPPGLVAASTLADDPTLLAESYGVFTSMASPPWVNGATTDAPSARYGHSAVWTGGEWMVWGGNLSALIYSGAGSIYNPATDQWRPISTINAPAARSGHTAVWSGDQMLVWGGFNADGYLRTGARIADTNANWTALTTNGAPVEREGHVAAWTGTHMIVWGGRNGSGLLDDGALFFTSSNGWSALTTSNAPSARFNAGSVWTGDRLLVWGGEGELGPLNTGGQLIYSNGLPAEWRAITTSNAPSARAGHTIVWTGSRLIIWGGEAGGALLGDGASYDPLTDTWTALPAFAGFAARTRHEAIWNGQELIVLGGETAEGTTASGAAFNPLTGQWRSLTTAGSPQARSDAVSVWTGTELLVFGGRAGGAPVAALQRLNPQPVWHLYRKL